MIDTIKKFILNPIVLVIIAVVVVWGSLYGNLKKIF